MVHYPRQLCEKQCITCPAASPTSLSKPLSPWRRATNVGFIVLASVAAVLVLAPLVAIFGYLLYKGIGSINVAFLTATPKPVGESGGGMANAIVGSMMILGLGAAAATLLGRCRRRRAGHHDGSHHRAHQ